jgi:hypothetical protein
MAGHEGRVRTKGRAAGGRKSLGSHTHDTQEVRADIYGWTYEHLQTLIGDKEAIKTLTRTLNHILGNRITSETAKDLNTIRVAPLLKGTKGKIRPITVGATLKRFALSTMIKCEKHVRELVGESEFAIGRKSAIEDMKRSIDATIDKVTHTYGKAVVFQLDCSCAFNRAPRQTCLTKLEEAAPHLLIPIGQWLTTPMTHILKETTGRPTRLSRPMSFHRGAPRPFDLFIVHEGHRRTIVQAYRGGPPSGDPRWKRYPHKKVHG